MLKIRFILRLILLLNCLYISTFFATKEENKCFICLQDLCLPEEIFDADKHVKNLISLKCCHVKVCEGCYEKAKNESGNCKFCKKIFNVEETSTLVQHNAGPRGNMTIEIKNYKIGHCEKKNCVLCDCENTILATFNMYGKENEKKYFRYEVAYFPNNKYGLEALGIFKIAFDNNLLFQIDNSVTNGTYGIVFNGIHFKTRTSGGETNHGYPDHGYLNRTKMSATNSYIPCVENNDIINNRKIGKCIIKNYLNKTFTTLLPNDDNYSGGYVDEKEFKQKVAETELTKEEQEFEIFDDDYNIVEKKSLKVDDSNKTDNTIEKKNQNVDNLSTIEKKNQNVDDSFENPICSCCTDCLCC